MKIVYGPVSSWRLGKSLGIDLLCSEKKICSFDCIYCQLGKQSNKITRRKNFIKIKDMKKELNIALEKTYPDVITFSGLGEPTLAKNIDLVAKEIKKITDIPLAILTNSTLIGRYEVKNALKNLDIVIAKLDASNEKQFQEINQPAKGINFKEAVKGIKDFGEKFSGKLDIQIMFIKNNMNFSEEIADVVCEIEPDETQINTPLRPCAIDPLTEEQLSRIEKIFIKKNLKTISVYKSTKPKITLMDKIEIFKRRGGYKFEG